MTEKFMYFYVLYCFFVNDILMDMLEDQLKEQGGPRFELQEEFILLDDKDKHWRDFIVGKKEKCYLPQMGVIHERYGQADRYIF